MKIEQFEMERMQSTWENLVRYNLSESGVHPATIGELIPDASQREALLNIELGYSQSNGTPELRRSIAAIYPGATEENVLATVGTAEAAIDALKHPYILRPRQLLPAVRLRLLQLRPDRLE